MIASVAAAPTQEECDNRTILKSEVDEALSICGRFDIFTPSMIKEMNAEGAPGECPIKLSMVQRGRETFRSYVYLMGKDAACHAFISGIQ